MLNDADTAKPITPNGLYKTKHIIKFKIKVGIEAFTGKSTLSYEKNTWLQILAIIYAGKEKAYIMSIFEVTNISDFKNSPLPNKT